MISISVSHIKWAWALTATLALYTPLAASASEPADAIVATPGTLPLILTVPHDGVESLGLPQRAAGTTVRDIDTAPLALRVADLLEQRLGKRPYVVIARFSRKVIDANRAENEALEHPSASPAWRAYHGAIAAYVEEVRKRYPGGALLLDIHGQGSAARTIFRGTDDGRTTRALVKRFGIESASGKQSIFGRLATKGYDIYPPIETTSVKEDPRYNGGYTVRRYGDERRGIDAIQFEFGSDLRKRGRTADDFADAIITFMQDHQLLPTSP